MSLAHSAAILAFNDSGVVGLFLFGLLVLVCVYVVRDATSCRKAIGKANNPDVANYSLVYKKIWKAILCDGERMVCKSLAREIAMQLLIPDKIDPIIFVRNYGDVVRGGFHSMREFYLGPQYGGSPSIQAAASPLGRTILACPIWFIAAYPDCYLWYAERQLGVGLRNFDMKALTKSRKLMRRYLLSGLIRNLDIKSLRQLVRRYQQETGQRLEVSASQTGNQALIDIYANKNIKEAILRLQAALEEE